MGEHLEAEIAAASVYGDDHALRPELLSQLAHQLGTVDCSRVNRDLVRTHPQEAARVLHAADAPADREGDEDLLGDPSGHLRSEEHTTELKPLMRTSYADFTFKQQT